MTAEGAMTDEEVDDVIRSERTDENGAINYEVPRVPNVPDGAGNSDANADDEKVVQKSGVSEMF